MEIEQLPVFISDTANNLAGRAKYNDVLLKN